MAYTTAKRLVDLVVAAIMLAATFPIWLMTALLLWCFQGRPVFFRQQRIGLHGMPFTLFKFRTMRIATPPRYADRPVAKKPGDDRVTPIGNLVRRLAIDEIPQLINILRGEMSLVGPRPLPQDDLEQPGWLHGVNAAERTRRLEWRACRHQVLPGLTGSWQISSAPEEDFENWIRCDLQYLAQRSALTDFRIFLLTPFAVLRGRQRSITR